MSTQFKPMTEQQLKERMLELVKEIGVSNVVQDSYRTEFHLIDGKRVTIPTANAPRIEGEGILTGD